MVPACCARRISGVALVTFITTVPIQAEQLTAPRDTPRPAKATGIIKGRVVDAQTGAALPRARVRLQMVSPQRPAVLTDDHGNFQIAEVPAASVRITVDRSGYVTGEYPEAGRTIRAVSRNITVAEGQVIEGVTIRMYRGGVITGRVLDNYGEPAEFTGVQLFRLPPGRGRPQPRGGSSTNDLGEFRIPRLEAGKYLLRAQMRSQNADDPSETQAAPTYYPNALTIDEAQAIAIERGQTVSGIEIMLMSGASSVVSGVVIDTKGQPPPMGTYINAGFANDFMFGGGIAGGPTRPDGSFQLKLPPGEYVLEVRTTRPGTSGGIGEEDVQVGRVRVTASGAPVTGLQIVLGPPGSMTGRIVLDGDGSPPPQLDQVLPALWSQGPGGGNCQSGRSTRKPDGTFRVVGVMGSCMLQLQGPLGQWLLKSVRHRDAELIDRPVAFEPGVQLRDVQFVLTDRRSEVNIHVADGRGNETRDYVALMFSTDESKWTENSRYVRLFNPQPTRGEKGDIIAAMLPGEYYIVAINDIAIDEARDADTLERLKSSAQRISITERTRADLRLRRIDFQSSR